MPPKTKPEGADAPTQPKKQRVEQPAKPAPPPPATSSKNPTPSPKVDEAEKIPDPIITPEAPLGDLSAPERADTPEMVRRQRAVQRMKKEIEAVDFQIEEERVIAEYREKVLERGRNIREKRQMERDRYPRVPAHGSFVDEPLTQREERMMNLLFSQ